MPDMFDIDTRHILYPRDSHERHVWLCSRGAQAMAVSITFTTLAACLVSARVYTRRYLVKHMEANDWIILIALVLFVLFFSSIRRHTSPVP